MHLKISAIFTFANRPKKSGPGITCQRWSFGHKGPLTLFEMCREVLGAIFDFYCALNTPEDLNAELGELRSWLEVTHFGEIAVRPKEGEAYLLERDQKGELRQRPLPFGRTVSDEDLKSN